MRSKEEKLKLLEETIGEYDLKKYSDPEYLRLEALSERVVYKSDNANWKKPIPMCLMVQNENGRNYDDNSAYFKIYNASNPLSATKMNRISFGVGKYIKHKCDCREYWFLNIKEIDELYRVLYSIHHIEKGKYITIWEQLEKEFKDKTGIEIKLDLDNRYYNLPNSF